MNTENQEQVQPAGADENKIMAERRVKLAAIREKGIAFPNDFVPQHKAADLVETLYRGLADNSVGRVIDTLLRHDLIICDEVGFAPLDDTGAQLLFRFIAAAYERRALGIASHWPFEPWGRFLPEHTTASACWTGSCTTPTSWSPTASPTACAKPEPDNQEAPEPADQPEGRGLLLGHQRGPQLGR